MKTIPNPTRGPWRVVGVMSGTSLDGLDICLVRFRRDGKRWQHEIESAVTLPYSKDWYESLRNAHLLDTRSLRELDIKYSIFIGNSVRDFIKGQNPENIQWIASHGHTVFHRPEEGFTLQIGNQPEIRQAAGIAVVCDFRKQDVKMGGQGAPLVPIGDALLYPEFDACVNFGGFANVSAATADHRRIAWDISPLNIVLNKWAQQLGFNYDEGGQLARTGKLDYALLKQLETLPYYRQAAPKSLGREWVEENIDPLLVNVSPKDVLRTCTEHFAQRMADDIKNYSKILCTGGGVYNTYLLTLIAEKCPGALVLPGKNEIEFKEATVFALLGLLRLLGENNVLSSVTGVPEDHCSGVIYE